MAPEQLEGKEPDARADIFAFGAMLYEMATGQRAFNGKSQASLIAAILASEPPPISRLQPLTPPALDRVVATCLAKDPDERWQSAHDLLKELTWIQEARLGAAGPPAAARRVRRERIAWVAVAIAAAGLAGLFVSLLARRDPRAAAHDPDHAAAVGQGARLRLSLRRRSGPFARRPPCRIRRQGCGWEGAALGPASRWPARPGATGDGRRDVSLLVGGQPDLGFLRRTQAEEDQRVGRSTGGLVRCRLGARRGMEPRRCDPLFWAAVWGAVPDRGYRGRGRRRPPNSMPRATRRRTAGRRSCPTGATSSTPLSRRSRRRLPTPSSSARWGRTRPSTSWTFGRMRATRRQVTCLFAREGALVAQPFDAAQQKLTGDAVNLADEVQTFPTASLAAFSVSENGLLAYQTGRGRASRNSCGSTGPASRARREWRRGRSSRRGCRTTGAA